MEILEFLDYEETKNLKRGLLDAAKAAKIARPRPPEEAPAGAPVCPQCRSSRVFRNGHRKNGTQKYICRTCGKAFSLPL